MMKYFVEKFIPQKSTILDIGGSDDYGTYKDIFNTSEYKTLNWEDGDYIVNGYDWSNVPSNYFDVAISGQAFEHDKFFWKTLENIKRIIKPNGIVIIIVPSKGDFHQYPLDCYRFYPDSAIIFAEMLNARVLNVVWNNEKADMKYNNENIKFRIFDYQFDSEWGDLGIIMKIIN